jgi:hypothetical protein
MIDPVTLAWGDPSSVWLVPANVALCATAVVCGYQVFRAVGDEVRLVAARLFPAENHAFDVAGLGVTMADGGEEISEKK